MKLSLISVLMLFVSLGAHAEVYKCKDIKGHVEYRDTPCPTSVKSARSVSMVPEPTMEQRQESNHRMAEIVQANKAHDIASRKESAARERQLQLENSYNESQEMSQPSRKKFRGRSNVRNAGAINPYTGEYYSPAAGGGYVGSRDGTYYAPAGGNGVIDTRTGQYIPVH